ncbi:hypothetical protein IEQ34_019024 [Dendrobium chrysotoxum]|uniref:Uncharacterized protein n=1 Tax=Dendrobium chrysotoxum TaxID=161865 RepID=A0AAV7FQ36_DENCH|nr:hypothetical protein IEQ34_019024 [Dendrobium chrysotoxum]
MLLAPLSYLLAIPYTSSLFGRPLKVDNVTSIGSRPSLALVLVELDITKNYPKKVWLDLDKFGYIQSVQMEAFPPFCDLYKVIGHVTGECQTLSFVPSPTTSTNPIKTVRNETSTVENVVVDGNVGVVSSNPLCPIKSFNEVLNFAGNGVGAAGAVDHSFDVGLVGPPLVISDGGSPVVPVVPEADALVMLVDVLDPPKQVVNEVEVSLSITVPVTPSCGNYEDGVDACDAPSCDSNVDVSDGEIEFFDDFVPLNPRDRECDPSADGILTLNYCEGVSASLPKGDDPMAKNLGVVDVPISVLSNDALLAHLTYNVRDYEVMHGDWLKDDISSTFGEEFDEKALDSRDNFDPSILQIADAIMHMDLSSFGRDIAQKSASSEKVSFHV